MPIRFRYTLKDVGSCRIYQGAKEGRIVGNWLNGRPIESETNSGKSRKRILDLLENLRAVIKMMNEVKVDFDWKSNPPPKKFHALTNELQTRLAEYPSKPVFAPEMVGNRWSIFQVAGGHRPPGESRAAYSIIQLARQNLLDRISQCACGKWYFARFIHQRSCSASCRRKLHEKTDAYREKRRSYMREYYRLKKSGKVK
jgi:hypothetical protein